MIQSYFEDLESIVQSELSKANKSVRIAVAWINFDLYMPILEYLLNKGIKIKILLNDDVINRRFSYQIKKLYDFGADIKFISCIGYMHHKFCIIDKRICVFGSFNWTYNANNNNIEDLNICDESSFVCSYLREFKALWDLNNTDIRLLYRPMLCNKCKLPVVNIMLLELENEYQTKTDVLQVCGCNTQIICTDYFDCSLYYNYYGLINYYEEKMEQAKQENNEFWYNELAEKKTHDIHCYLSSVRFNRMGLQIIHAIGFRASRYIYGDEENHYYKIVWKERGTSQYINDEYDAI